MVICKEIILAKNFLLIDDCNFFVNALLGVIGFIYKFLRSESDKGFNVELTNILGLDILGKS
jgi:hypothetical protein